MTWAEISSKMKQELAKYGSTPASMVWQRLYSRHIAEYRELYRKWLLYKCKYCPKRHEFHCDNYKKKGKWLCSGNFFLDGEIQK